MSRDYTSEAGTQLLATTCIMCGRALRDPDSVERGIGPDCAEKAMFFPGRIPGQVDEDALVKALADAPEDLRDAYQRGLPESTLRAVSFAIHNAGHHWEHDGPDASKYLRSLVGISRASGYGRLGDIVSDRFVKLLSKPVVKVTPDKLVSGARVQLADGREGTINWIGSYRGAPSYGVDVAGERAFVRAEQIERVDAVVVAQFAPSDFAPLPINVVTTTGERRTVTRVGTSARGFWMLSYLSPGRSEATKRFLNLHDIREIENAAPPLFTFEEVKAGSVATLRDGRKVLIAKAGVSRAGNRYIIGNHEGVEDFVDLYDIVALDAPNAAGRARLGLAQEDEVFEERELTLQSGLFAHQVAGAEWIASHAGSVLADDMGLGKTATSISALTLPAVIVVPASLRQNWLREIDMWGPGDVSVAIVGERKADLDADIVIVNYERLKGAVLDKLILRGNTTLIVDEAHALKNLRVWPTRTGDMKLTGSARAEAVWRLAYYGGPGGGRITQRVLLTGTPMPNGRHHEMFPLLNIADGGKTPAFRSFGAFAEEFCDVVEMFVQGRKVRDYDANKHPKALHDAIQPLFLRRTKDLLDLPEKVRSEKLLDLSEDARKEYALADREFREWYRGHRGSDDVRAEAIVRLTALRKIAAVGKVPGLAEEIKYYSISTGRPLVVMAHHREVIQTLESLLVDEGLRVARIDGDTKDRQGTVDRFQAGKLDVLLCSITAAGVGLTLTAADTLFMAERVWRPYDLRQAEDRIHRIGQKNTASIVYYDAPGTIDEHLAEVLTSKIESAEAVLEGKEGSNDAKVLDKVLESYR